jgi:predicted PurR-regulated permease PerM
MDINIRTEIRRSVRLALILLLLFLLLFALYNALSAFIGVFTFAIIFSVSFHGLFERLRPLAGRFKKLPAMIYGLLMVSLVAVPFIFLVRKLAVVLQDVMNMFGEIQQGHVPTLPGFIRNLPFLGDRAAAIWAQLEKDPAGTIGVYDEQIKNMLQHLVSGGTGIMGAGFELILGIIVSAVLLHYGKKALEPLETFLANLAGEDTGDAIIDASGKAIKGVAIGVMGTGLIAALAAWIGFAIAGVGIAGILAAITFFLVVIQVGPLLVWLPVALWLGHEDETGRAIFVTIYGIVVLMGIDNILKPILIGRSGKLPILVLFLGVVGGMAAWGFTGMFKGALVLAIFYTLIQTWTTRKNGTDTDQEAAENDSKHHSMA